MLLKVFELYIDLSSLSYKGVAPLPGGEHEGQQRVLWQSAVRLRGLRTPQGQR